ncbi:MAG: hypothetical protein ACRC28_05250 [Clostridium sp.]|uniref:hypothetical protein n=1 Tax=Clostridium sp. TaxID=1506 RepID=UPI003F2A896D
MRRKIRKVTLVAMVFVLAFVYMESYEREKGIRIEEFENIYNGESIEMFYEEIRDRAKIDEKIIKLEEIYKVKEICEEEPEEIKKIVKATEILNMIGKKDDVEETKYFNGYDILSNSEKEKKKFSDKDIAIIGRDLILGLGFEARVGIFKKENPQFEKDAEYYVIEYWSPEFNKWVMIDFNKRGYLKKNGEILSGIELLDKDFEESQFYGEEKSKDYKKYVKKYLSSYTIAIDNTIKNAKSNSYITYIKGKKDIDILSEGKYIRPTIFTENRVLYEKSPFAGIKREDKKAYIILMKKELDKEDENLPKEEKEIEENKMILAAFKNGKVLKNYKYRINGEEFKEVKDFYEEIIIKKEVNKIEISVDGKSIDSVISIKREI